MVDSEINFSEKQSLSIVQLILNNKGKDIIKQIFEALDSKKGFLLMPEDTRTLLESTIEGSAERKRVICDFIAGMTDRYAIEFWGRLYSDRGVTMFKPL